MMADNRSSEIPSITDDADYPSLYSMDFQQFLRKDIPAVTFLTILSIIGTVGNIHTLLVYFLSKKLTKLVAIRSFILWLSSIDLIACVVCIPFEIIDIRYSYTFKSAESCKFFRFLTHAVTLASGGLLTAIAIERYNIFAKKVPRIIAKPSFVMNIVSAIVVGISVLLSTPAFVFYGLNKKETGIINVTGTDCTVMSEYQHMKTAGVYSGIVFLLSTACCLICFVVYGKILYIIINQIRKEHKKKPHNSTLDLSSDISSKETHQVSISQLGEGSQKSNSHQREVTGLVKSNSKYEKGRRLTVSLIVATGVSYLGYIIYASTILVKLANPTLYKSSIRPATAVLLRAFFINNAVNPVVFCFIDCTFREECLKLYDKTACRKKCLKG